MTTVRPLDLNPNLRFARLYGALPEDVNVSTDRDLHDAEDVIIVARALRDLHRRVHPHNSSPITNSLRTRGFLEQAWERRRRRGLILNSKFAAGSLWSAPAHRLAFDGPAVRARTEWSGALLLEHVVPARVIASVVEDMLDRDVEVSQVCEVLYALHHHVVLTKADDRSLRSAVLGPAEVRALRDHFSGVDLLAEAELEGLVWSRYPDDLIRGLVVPIPAATG